MSNKNEHLHKLHNLLCEARLYYDDYENEIADELDELDEDASWAAKDYANQVEEFESFIWDLIDEED